MSEAPIATEAPREHALVLVQSHLQMYAHIQNSELLVKLTSSCYQLLAVRLASTNRVVDAARDFRDRSVRHRLNAAILVLVDKQRNAARFRLTAEIQLVGSLKIFAIRVVSCNKNTTFLNRYDSNKKTSGV